MSKLSLSSAAALLALAIAAPALAADPPANAPPAAPSTPESPAPAKADSAPPKADAAPAKAESAPAKTDIAPVVEVAQPPEGEAPKKNVAQDPVVHTRRGGFTFGLSAAFGIGPISGYPLDVAKLGKARYLTEVGASTGANGTVWIGGALTDWLVFGLGAGGTYSVGNGIVTKGYTFVFHTEAFPLFWAGGPLREIGIAFDTGAGQITAEPEQGASPTAGPLIDSGAASRVGASLFYEGLKLWKVSAGPFAAFDYTWSASLSQPLFLIGLRTSLYAKAPTK